MTDKMNILPPIIPGQRATTQAPRQGGHGGGFDRILEERMQARPVQFSRHAQDRLSHRGVQFDQQQMQRLENAVGKVHAKGGRDSLVMLDQTALVVSVTNRTVVTVVAQDQLQENVFTNIDSAVIA